MRSLTIARIKGIAIEVHPSWLLILGLVSWTLSEEAFPSMYEDWSTAAYWIVGTAAALLLFVTVLLHELAHALVAKRRGLDVPKITLFIFGGVSHLSRQPKSAGEEFAIAIAGPATSFVIAVVTGVAAAFAGNEKAEGILGYLATVNLLLGVFNLLPGFPLDGGRVLRSIAWERTKSFRKATRIAGGVGELFAYLLMGLGFMMFIAGYPLNGLWALLIAWFLLGAARAETSSVQLDSVLGKLKAGDVMNREFASVSPDTRIQAVVDDFVLGRGERAVMVAEDGAVRGILTITDIQKAARERWPLATAESLMTPRDKVVAVETGTGALDVLAMIGQRHLNQVPVIDGGRMVGLISRRDLVDRIQMTEALRKGDDGES
jgi:Zn-dependent protease